MTLCMTLSMNLNIGNDLNLYDNSELHLHLYYHALMVLHVLHYITDLCLMSSIIMLTISGMTLRVYDQELYDLDP